MGRLAGKVWIPVALAVAGLVPAPRYVLALPCLITRSAKPPMALTSTRQLTTVPLTGEVTFAPGSGSAELSSVVVPLKKLLKEAVSGLPTVTVAAWALLAAMSAPRAVNDTNDCTTRRTARRSVITITRYQAR